MTASAQGRGSVAMLLWGTGENDSRVTKEATALASAGSEVTVVCLAAPHLPEREARDGVRYQRVEAWPGLPMGATTAPEARPPDPAAGPGSTKAGRRGVAHRAGRAIRGFERRFPRVARPRKELFRALLFHRVYRTMEPALTALRPAVLHAHDLHTLPAAARVARRIGAKLVYDSHELATDLSVPTSAPLRAWLERVERRSIADADAVITVSEGIAGRLADRYGIRRPIVVLNSPPTNEGGSGSDVRGNLGLAPGVPLAVWVGGLMAGRGLEQTVGILEHIPDLHLACVGPREPAWERDMTEWATSARSSERLHFLDPVPVEELVHYLATADVGVVAIQDVSLSYRFSLPSKLFETVLAGVPTVVSDLPDMRGFVEHNGVGLVAEQPSPEALAAAVAEVLDRGEELAPRGARLEGLRERYGWEAQARVLTEVYASALRG